jgi:His-Xaa-Ser repeat protein HxsA
MDLTPRGAEPRPPQPLAGSTNKFAAIVRQVQAAMVAYGYYKGPIDGVVGADMREALTRMQTDYGLKATGTITPQTLDALRIVAQ